MTSTYCNILLVRKKLQLYLDSYDVNWCHVVRQKHGAETTQDDRNWHFFWIGNTDRCGSAYVWANHSSDCCSCIVHIGVKFEKNTKWSSKNPSSKWSELVKNGRRQFHSTPPPKKKHPPTMRYPSILARQFWTRRWRGDRLQWQQNRFRRRDTNRAILSLQSFLGSSDGS